MARSRINTGFLGLSKIFFKKVLAFWEWSVYNSWCREAEMPNDRRGNQRKQKPSGFEIKPGKSK